MVAALLRPDAEQAPSFEQLFERYRGDDAGAAVREFAKWPEARVQSEARLPGWLAQDPRAIARLALFHVEAGIERGTFGSAWHPLAKPSCLMQRCRPACRSLRCI